MKPIICLLTLILATTIWAQSPMEPFTADENTRLLYHFDEQQGDVVKDASSYAMTGEIKGAKWDADGRFDGAMWFDGANDSVFVKDPQSLMGLKQITVECWFKQESSWSRRFLVGHDVGFHFEIDDNSLSSISLYNEGGAVNNSEGKPHQQVAMICGSYRPYKWHHSAITYDGQTVSFFMDGQLKGRRPGPKDFTLGVASRGLWVGCYVDMDYYFSGWIDEVRVSDCVRYDPEMKLNDGERIFEIPQSVTPLRPKPAVREAQKTGLAEVNLKFKKLFGSTGEGWVYLKPPGKPAVVVGQYKIEGDNGSEQALSLDVSDEFNGPGQYIVGLEQTNPGAYFVLTEASMNAGGKTQGIWTGEARSRKTFQPPVLASIQVGDTPLPSSEGRRVFVPQMVDRAWGNLEIITEDNTPMMTGDGYAEWWFNTAKEQAYRVYMRYTSPSYHPCDMVIDGDDLNEFDMCGANATGRPTPKDAYWEYQGTKVIGAGIHWLRIQDIPPDIVAISFEPVTETAKQSVSWSGFVVPAADALRRVGAWEVQQIRGIAEGMAWDSSEGDLPALAFKADFKNIDSEALMAADYIRMNMPVQWNMEPVGRLRFTFEGKASGHTAAIWLVDAKGDEKLVWRLRDESTEPIEVEVPLSFEGNDVFDGRRVTGFCIDLDEANYNPQQKNSMIVGFVDLKFDFRDSLLLPEGYQERLQAALGTAEGQLETLPVAPEMLLAKEIKPWTKLVVPEEHPLYATTEPKPVTRELFGENLHFTGPRDISPDALRTFHDLYNFGDVCWPHIGILPQRRNYDTEEAYQAAHKVLEENLYAVRDRNMYLFDIWGYVPYDEAGPTPQVTPQHDEILKRIMGDKFTGYDNGEQDGRYIGAYADRGAHTNRIEGWEDFVKWDELICGDNMNYMNATGSLNYSHYYGERGARMLGLETAQGLPSDTLMFSFLRGAAKQYGRLTYQATSVWNRYGWNLYSERITEGGNAYGHGPHKGTSLSLHKRLFFQSYTGNDVITGTETGQFTGDQLEENIPELSPLGAQHLKIKEWTEKYPDRGVLHTPIAFMLDFYNGWNMPRHLYRGDKYKVWGKLPYEKGDYLIDGMFRFIWPGYEDCSYLRNERGFVTPTPFGDIFDVLNNRCVPEVINQYSALMLMGDVEITPEVARNLEGFVQSGGDLLIDARQAVKLPVELTGIESGSENSAITTIFVETGDAWAEQPYTYTKTILQTATPLLVNETGDAVMTVNTVGKGRVIVCTADYWMTDTLQYVDPKLVNMEPPYQLLEGVKAVMGVFFNSNNPVEVNPGGLNVRCNYFENKPKQILVGLTNNDMFANWSGAVTMRQGEVASARDLWSGKDLKVDGANINVSVPAGDVAMVEVQLK